MTSKFNQSAVVPSTNDIYLEDDQSGKRKLKSTSALKSLSRRFSKDEGGNVALIFGVSSLMIYTLAAMAIDYSRANLVRSDLTDAMDAAGLAMAQFSSLNEDVSDAQLVTFGEAVFFENFKHANLVDDLDVEFSISPTTIRPRVEGTLDAILLTNYKIGGAEFNFTNFNMGAETEITKRGSGRVELSLVLDVTGSMNDFVGNSNTTKLEDLKTSVDAMLGTLYGDANQDDNIRMSVVPFNAHVNVGSDSSVFSENWLDTNADAHYHGHRFIHAQMPTENDTSLDARKTNSDGGSSGTDGYNNSTGVPEMINPDVKVNHFDLFNSNNQLSWSGCVEARPYPLDELDTEPGMSTSTGVINSTIGTAPEGVNPQSSVEDRVDDAFDEAPSLSVSASIVGSSNSSRWVPLFEPDAPECLIGGGDCFSIGGSNEKGFNSHNLYGYQHGTTFRRFFYDNPNDNGHSENTYDNNSFVRDASFSDDITESNPGSNFLFYNDFVLGSRYALGENFTGGSYWDRVKDAFHRVGMFNLGREEYIARTAYVGLYNPSTQTYTNRYDNTVTLNLGNNDRNPNRDCPQSLLPLTTNRLEVSEKVNGLVANGTTNSAFGAMWGWRTLSPGAPFDTGAAYDDGQWQKAIVIMTDGENFVSDEDTHWKSGNTAFGFASEERMGDGIDSRNEMRDEIDNKMLRICQRMKQEGIIVYTIMFGLESTRAENLYKACATTPDAPYFHNASSGVDLEEAFGDIAADLVNLHISK